MNATRDEYPHPLTARRLINEKKIAERIKTALLGRGVESHGMGSELARLTGRTSQAAASWLKGTAMPRYDNLLRICYGYGININWVMDGTEPMYQSDGLDLVRKAWIHTDERGRNLLETVAKQIIEN